MKKRNKETAINYVKSVPFLILAVVVMLSIGYAEYASNMVIQNVKAVVRADELVRVTNAKVSGSTSGGTSNSLEFGKFSVSSSVSLPSSDSTVTYMVEITNLSEYEKGVVSITGLPSQLEYTISDYNIGSTLCDDVNITQCTLGISSTFHITIGYKEGEYNSNSTTFPFVLEFEFDTVEYVARIGNQKYQTLQAAVNAVQKDGPQTTIVLLKNSVQHVIVSPGKNIVLDMPGLVLSNDGNNPVITIRGVQGSGSNVVRDTSTVTITNGTIYTDQASAQGAINVEDNGVLNMTGGSIICDGTKQTIYISGGGSATISGNSYLSAKALVESNSKRGTVQTLANGSLTILGGTIVAEGLNGIAVSNAGTTTIGTEDGNVDSTSPVIQGMDYGIYLANNSTFNFYDGIAKGRAAAINNETLITDKEAGHGIFHSEEAINGATYYTVSLTTGTEVTVTFDPGDGTTDEPTRLVISGATIGGLPLAEQTGYRFVGWFTADGREITAEEVITGPVTFYAHWLNAEYVARIGDDYYPSVQDAVDAVPTDNTKKIITLLVNVSNENIFVDVGKNIEFDLQNYTISTVTGIVLENAGTIEIKNGTLLRTGSGDQFRTLENRNSGAVLISGGTIQSNYFQAIRNYGNMTITGGIITIGTTADQGVINNESGGVMNISGGNVRGYKRQAVYNDGGTLTISGSAYLESDITVTNKVRGAVHNNAGTTIITGGTIITNSTSNPAVMNNATMTIGVDDGVINGTSPIIQSRAVGLRIESNKTVRFYDGIIRGGSSNNPINNESAVITDTQNNVTIGHRDDMVNGVIYKAAYLTQ